MKKQLLILGITILLLFVGLSGCEEVGIGLTNIGDINANPDEYLGKEVTVEGWCAPNIILDYSSIVDDSAHYILFKYSTALNGKFRLTGIVKQGDVFNCYIDVTKAKAI